ncbi:MAG TPA: rhomboid family intramembrane serine protease [Spirochaetia bacterium]|nr:rhomboid family intramembrane serine protease [Spirochaetales bacterium]HRY73950.1 rhomboid family intramembrane serine protease [Spirochaetia bacterium]
MDRSSLVRRPFPYSNRNLCLYLIGANILVTAFGYLSPAVPYLLAMNPMSVLSGRIWQPFTYMFVHADLSHLLVNMLGLLFFGTQVERELGSSEFLLYYLLTGFLAGLFSLAAYLLAGAYSVFLLGASGAVFAVLLAYAALFPNSDIYVWGILPVRAPVLVVGYTLIEVVSQLFSFRSSVAHLTHLAGFGFGWLYFLVRFGVNPGRRFFPRR